MSTETIYASRRQQRNSRFPRLNGLSALMKIRESYKIPAIILSAKTEESDKVSGLVLGADDYVSNPYNATELIARVKAQLRRYNSWGGGSPASGKDKIINGGLVLDKKTAYSHSRRERDQAYCYRIQDIKSADGKRRTGVSGRTDL